MTRPSTRALMTAAFLVGSMPAHGQSYAGSLKDRLRAEVKGTFVTPKKPYDLEICVADVIEVLGVPVVYRDGPNDIVIAASTAGKFMGSVNVRSTPTGSSLELRLVGRGWDDRLRARIRGCL